MWLCATFFCFYFLTKRECKSLQQTKEMKKMSNVQYLFFSHFLVKLASNERQIFFFSKWRLMVLTSSLTSQRCIQGSMHSQKTIKRPENGSQIGLLLNKSMRAITTGIAAYLAIYTAVWQYRSPSFQDKDSKLDIFWPKFICLETPQKLVNQVWSLFATLLRPVDYFDFCQC